MSNADKLDYVLDKFGVVADTVASNYDGNGIHQEAVSRLILPEFESIVSKLEKYIEDNC